MASTPGFDPGVLRPITFDAKAAEGRADLVYVHLGHPIVQKAQRLLRRSLWSVDSPLSRVTAVVVDDLEESFVAAVTRMVLVGRGGIRLHEEVFLAGVRLRGRRAMAEEKAEAALDKALDRKSLRIADQRVRDQLCDLWNVPDAPLRLRLEESMQARAGRRHELVLEQLAKRQDADMQRAQGDLRRLPRQPARLACATQEAKRTTPKVNCSPIPTSSGSGAATSTP